MNHQIRWSINSEDSRELRDKFINGELHPAASMPEIFDVFPEWKEKYRLNSLRPGVKRVKEAALKMINDGT
jgi:hypothetical protein